MLLPLCMTVAVLVQAPQVQQRTPTDKKTATETRSNTDVRAEGAQPASHSVNNPSSGDRGQPTTDDTKNDAACEFNERMYHLAMAGVLINALYLAATVGIFFAALKANKHARSSYEVSSRAWITYGDLGDSKTPIAIDDGKQHEFPIEFKNIGRVPATEVRTLLQVALLAELPKTLTFNIKQQAAPTVIGPDDKRDVFAIIPPISAADCSKIGTGELTLFLWGQATYTDGFGKERLTQFCFRLDPSRGRWTDVGKHHAMT